MASLITEMERIRLRQNGLNMMTDSGLRLDQEMNRIKQRNELQEARERAAQAQREQQSERLGKIHEQWSEPTKKFLTTSVGLTQALGDQVLAVPQVGASLLDDTLNPQNMKENFAANMQDLGFTEPEIEAQKNNLNWGEYNPDNILARTGQYFTEKRADFDKFMDEADRKSTRLNSSH